MNGDVEKDVEKLVDEHNKIWVQRQERGNQNDEETNKALKKKAAEIDKKAELK